MKRYYAAGLITALLLLNPILAVAQSSFQRFLGFSDNTTVYGLKKLTSGRSLLLGGVQGNQCLAFINDEGDLRSSYLIHYDGSTDIRNIDVSSANSTMLAGRISSNSNFAYWQYFIAKLDPDRLTFGWQRVLDVPAYLNMGPMMRLNDGGCVATLYYFPPPSNFFKCLLICYSTDGKLRWSRYINARPRELFYFNCLYQSVDGSIITGTNREPNTILLSKWSQEGKIITQRTYHMPQNAQNIFKILTAPDGGMFIVATRLTNSQPELVVYKLASTLEEEWVTIVNCFTPIEPTDAIVRKEGVLTIATTTTADFNGKDSAIILDMSTKGEVLKSVRLASDQKDTYINSGGIVERANGGLLLANNYRSFPNGPFGIHLLSTDSLESTCYTSPISITSHHESTEFDHDTITATDTVLRDSAVSLSLIPLKANGYALCDQPQTNSTAEVQNTSMTFSPNPFSKSQITKLHMTNMFPHEYILSIKNIFGLEVYRSSGIAVDGDIELSVGNISSGIYMLELIAPSSLACIWRSKIIKE